MGTRIKEWEELGRQEVFRKYTHRIERVDFRLPDGSEADFYIKAAGEVAAIVALTADNRVVLARQFRPGPMEVLNELPGGAVDPGEKPLEAIRRELLEETGYEGEIAYAGACYDDAYSQLKRHCFVARNCQKVAEPQQTPTEQIETVLLSVMEFRQLLRSGELTDIEIGYLGLDYLGLL